MGNINQDRLLSATRAMDALGSLQENSGWNEERARLQHNFSVFQEGLRQDRFEKSIEIERERAALREEELNLKLREEEREIKKAKVETWEKNRAAEAASFSAAAVPKIDLTTPEGEQELGNWMSYAHANGVSSQEMETIFGAKIREKKVRSEFRIRTQIESLGEDGLLLYDAFIEQGVNPTLAGRVARNSVKAQQTYQAWVEFAEEKGIGFVIPPEDMARIKKRVGVSETVQINENTFDATPYAWDLDELNAALSKHLSPELKKLADQESKIKGAEASKATSEASIAASKAQLGVAAPAAEVLSDLQQRYLYANDPKERESIEAAMKAVTKIISDGLPEDKPNEDLSGGNSNTQGGGNSNTQGGGNSNTQGGGNPSPPPPASLGKGQPSTNFTTGTSGP